MEIELCKEEVAFLIRQLKQQMGIAEKNKYIELALELEDLIGKLRRGTLRVQESDQISHHA